MDFGTLGGLILAATLLIGGMSMVAPLITYFDVASIVIVVGCTFAGFIVSTPVSKLKLIILVGKAAFREKKVNLTEVIPLLVSFAEKARREGLLALEDDIEDLQDPFLKRGIQLVVDGTDPELVKSIMVTQMAYIEDRHLFGKGIFGQMAELAPAFGMVGTLIGLIAMLLKMDDPAAIGPSMAVALITTLYGSIMANVIFIPMVNKLTAKSSDEILLKKIMLEGMLSIQAGDNPRIVDEKLKAFLPPALVAKELADTGGEGGGE